ncbi:hypothetical protein [Flavobacterium algicola]|uniref:hypothetical protein n=1 Tax=Flavobacterium algicola TaxID=556529 RepID=UPI001EFCAF22|nr:hypothetical protein [Flavobacterium algicola]MCG9790988.1 hypothetical protein [Flavobacterium algicola]
MKKNLQLCIKSSFFTLAISLIVTLWISSLFEVISKIFSGVSASNILMSFGFSVLADIESVLLIAILLYPIYFLFGYLKKPIAQMSIHILFSLLVIAQFALAKYQYTNFVNLGADFFGYSFDNLLSNVSGAESISIFYLIPFMFFPISYLMIEKYFSNISFIKK